MSPDLSRLCDAVEVVCNHHGMVTCDADHEAIVRAVLTELRDPSGAMIRSMCRAMSPGRRPTPERVSVSEKHTIRWQAVIDRILEEPALAEAEVAAAGVPVRGEEG